MVVLEEAKTRETAIQYALQEMQFQFEETKAMLMKECEAANKAAEQTLVIKEKLRCENEELKALVSSLGKKNYETEKKYQETSKISEEVVQLKTAMQSLEVKVSHMESENQILRQQISEHLSTRATELLLQNVDALINCVTRKIGFSHGKPVAAFTIYKCLMHWKSFEAQTTSVLDRLIQIVSEIEKEDCNDHLSYWLSNTSTLLFLLQRSLKAAVAAPHRKPPPPLQQLTAHVEKICLIICDNLKRELASMLRFCIQAPRVLRSGHSFGKDSHSSHWQSIIESLNALLNTLNENFVPSALVQKIFTQVFSFINVELFNSLLLFPEYCTFITGEYVIAGLAELELWCCQAKEYAGSSWDELKHIRQAVGFLVISCKPRFSYDEIANDLCPVLSVEQLYRICTMYWEKKYVTGSVSSDVILSLRFLMKKHSTDAVGSSFLLNDYCRIPFSVDDLMNSLQEEDFSQVKPAEELRHNLAFRFLYE